MRLRPGRSQTAPLRVATVAVVGAAALLAGVLIPQQILAARRAASLVRAPEQRLPLASGCCVPVRRAAVHRASAWHEAGQVAQR